jgi:DNA-binding transcriptional LysR family regulator
MRRFLDLDLLRTLVALDDTGSINRAADRVSRSQAGASGQLRRLEMLVGRPLLLRTAQGTRFTPAGEILLRHARRILNVHDEAWAEMLESNVSGIVRLGLPDDYVGMLLPPLLSNFTVRHPMVAIDVKCEPTPALRNRFVRGGLDIALITAEVGTDRDGGQELRREDLVWVGSADGGTPWMADPLPLALSHFEAPDRVAALAALSKAGRTWRVVHESDSAAALLAAVRGGVAVAVLAHCAVPSGVRLLGINEGLPCLPQVSILMRAAAQSPSSAALRLADHIASLLPGLTPGLVTDRPAN